MALSGIQKSLITQELLYKQVSSMVSDLDRQMQIQANKLEWLNNVSAQDLTDLAIPAEVQTLLADMRTQLNILIGQYNTTFASIADQIRSLW